MSERLTTLRKELEELRGAGSRMSRLLRAAALSLETSGTPIPATLLIELRLHRTMLEELKSRTMDAATDRCEAPAAEPLLGQAGALRSARA